MIKTMRKSYILDFIAFKKMPQLFYNSGCINDLRFLNLFGFMLVK